MSNVANVTVYSTSWCGFCHMAKEYFKKLGIAFKDVNIEEDQSAAMYIMNKTRQAGVPVIEIGDEVIIGFDRPKIDSALKANNLTAK